MPLFAVGISHHTAPLETRERLAITRDQYAEKIGDLLALDGVREAVILSTCNRTEIYTAVSGGNEAIAFEWLSRHGKIDDEAARQLFYSKPRDEAVRHLFRVACGLDSLVLGEPQIMGQLKEAWNAARDAGGAGKVTDRLFQRAFAISKDVRSHTGINDHPVSVAYISSVLARQIFGDLSNKSVLMVGAGEMIQLCGQHFHQHGVRSLMIANRSLHRAVEVGEPFGAEALPLDAVADRLPQADIVICSTSASHHIIDADMVRAAIRKRRRRPMFMVDLGVPRDIAPAVGELNDVYLYSIDDLRQVADESLSKRREAAQAATDRIEHAVHDFLRWLHGMRAAEGLRKLREQAEFDSERLAMRALHQIESGGDPAEVVRQLGNTLTHRILHGPSTRLREAAEQQQDDILRAADWLFESTAEDDGEGGNDAGR